MDAVTNHGNDGRIHLALVTKTYAPEVNCVAMTLGRLVDGLLAAEHRINLFRPGRHPADARDPDSGLREFIMPGLPIPAYTSMHFGFPATARYLETAVGRYLMS